MSDEHVHTEECFQYAMKTVARHGNGYCIDRCAQSYKKFKEELRIMRELCEVAVKDTTGMTQHEYDETTSEFDEAVAAYLAWRDS